MSYIIKFCLGLGKVVGKPLGKKVARDLQIQKQMLSRSIYTYDERLKQLEHEDEYVSADYLHGLISQATNSQHLSVISSYLKDEERSENLSEYHFSLLRKCIREKEEQFELQELMDFLKELKQREKPLRKVVE